MSVISKDLVVYETDHFIAHVPSVPHIPREDGGHIIICSRGDYYCSRLDLTPAEAKEVMRVTMLVSEAMVSGMKNRNIHIERINYQENGNWGCREGKTPFFHIHLYGRTRNAKSQTWGEALVFPYVDTGFYKDFEPFDQEDIAEIKKQIRLLEDTGKYDLKNW